MRRAVHGIFSCIKENKYGGRANSGGGWSIDDSAAELVSILASRNYRHRPWHGIRRISGNGYWPNLCSIKPPRIMGGNQVPQKKLLALKWSYHA